MKRLMLAAATVLVLSTVATSAALARAGTSTCPLVGGPCVGSGGATGR
ncbi:hypothetical protein ACQ4M4_20515 [Leptolyngbya sp. AN02str]